MLDLKFIRENVNLVKENAEKKLASVDTDKILQLDERRREIIREVEQLKNQRNVVSKEIAQLKKEKQNAGDKIDAMKEVSNKIKEMDEELRQTQEELNSLLLTVPNIMHVSVPVGKTEEDNKVIRTWGKPKEKIEKNHIDISKELGILDFERGAKVTGAGFAFYTGMGAALERALINYMISHQVNKNGYSEIMPPFVVNRNSMIGTGQLPKMEEDMYHTDQDDLYLIPTAEVPITNYYAGEVIKDELPIKFCGFSPCFRREAGSYGKEVHGFLRVHQFNKVELVKFVYPENSYDELESLTADAESVLQALELPYKVALLCSGDTSFSSAKTCDLEVWTPGEQLWLEVSSCSNFEDFQARRANIRFKRDANSKPEYPHTLNGSGLATSRLMVAIIENYYDSELNRIKVPEVLKTYLTSDLI